MAATPCDRIRADLSAYADQTLTPRRWEQVSYHLAGCADCRAELAAIDAVCGELNRCRASGPSTSLAARLEAIAGEQAQAPLYMASGQGELPSARRDRGRRVAQGSVVTLLAMVSVVVLAVLIAPDPPRLTNLVGAARQQFSMSAASIGTNEAIGAVLLAVERGADLGESVSYQPVNQVVGLTPVSAERAVNLLTRAVDASVTVSGVQGVWVSDNAGRYRSAQVRTAKRPGEGTQLEVLDSRGDGFMSASLPTLTPQRVTAPEGWSFAEGSEPVVVGGRAATQLQASQDGRPVAGWWFDTETGIQLWAERYDAYGAVSIATGFKQLSFGEQHLNGGAAQLIALQPASGSQTEGWCVGLSECPQELGGLPLVAYASSNREAHRSMTLVYSDGFESAVVGWTEGLLAEDGAVSSAQSSGLPTLYWQSGEAVVWATTNGSYELLCDIADELPQEAPYPSSLLDRVAAGLNRLVPVR
ncbi:Putative zinc-finger [Tessaracoccus bendigoensis DSM 12906]|uniref:Putative zinc-finger n=1 Tax=Tessaracoccus bendigoensis DSM 12906 TaxID=1123357 RepID=A0A1M6EY35_9ACTN|nr:zf-HC2 domain-containing protein [Tessaracoccus bendigoensis]SHI90352.1 Putative zinc-finger [Tessaracoccus bendigoensis DSM 12906]